MSKFLIATLLCLMVIVPSTLCQDVSVDALLSYNKWRFNNKRVYLNEDEQIYRQTVFFENLKLVNEHSQNPEATYQVGLNQFSDMTKDEFHQRILNKRLNSRSNDRNLAADPSVSNKVFPAPPASVDWRNKGILNAVKDQGSCGSCWTFAAVGVIESFNAITNKKLERYSEQQLVDCVHINNFPNSDGCDGGFQEDGVRYSIKFGNVKSSSYPYVGVGGKCKITSPISSSQGFYPKKFQTIPQDDRSLKQAIAFAPTSVSVDASTWSNYSRGVFNGCGKTTMDQLNHAVIAVGYDAQGNWIVRNSWNTYWGESGYIRLAAGNTCGVLLDNLVVTE